VTKPRFVEAMIEYRGGAVVRFHHETYIHFPPGLEAKLEAAIRAAIEKATSDGVAVAPSNLAERALDVFESARADFDVDVDCSGHINEPSSAPLVTTRSNEGLHRQLSNANFLTGEIVAIVRLSDLEALIATAEPTVLEDEDTGESPDMRPQIRRELRRANR
jgi:hypothetical protein